MNDTVYGMRMSPGCFTKSLYLNLGYSSRRPRTGMPAAPAAVLSWLATTTDAWLLKRNSVRDGVVYCASCSTSWHRLGRSFASIGVKYLIYSWSYTLFAAMVLYDLLAMRSMFSFNSCQRPATRPVSSGPPR